MESGYPKLVDVLPTLARSLRESLLRADEPNLAAQLVETRVHATCACDEDGCLSVHVAPEREPCVGHYRVVTPDAVVTVGVCRERLDWIEDNEHVSPAQREPLRRKEYEALKGQVPARPP